MTGDADTAGIAAGAAAGAVRIGLVWAQARGGVIGAGGGMPWHVPEDLAHFKQITLGVPVIMGRKTWDSLPERFRPLPGRANLVVTRQPEWASEGAVRTGSLAEALERAAAEVADADPDAGADADAPGARVWVIGGGELFAEALPLADLLQVTELDLDVDGDAHAPAVGPEWSRVAADPADGWHTSRTGIRYRFTTLTR